MSETVVELIIIAVLVLINGVFVAAEISLITVRRSRVEQLVEEDRRGARRVQRLIEDPGHFLAVVQLAVTFISFLASGYAAVSLVESLSAFLEQSGVDRGYAAGISLILVTILLSLFTIVFGELVPKTLALAHPERFALSLSPLVAVVGRVFGPVVRALTAVTRTITRSLGVDVGREAHITAEELKLIIERGGEQGVLEAEEEQMINAVIELGSVRVHEVMVPRIAITGLPATASFEEATDVIIAAGHSRIPVYEESIDHVVGILYAKDLLPFLKSDVDPRPALKTLVRAPVLVPESLPVDDVLHQLQRKRVHMAIVLDEYGGTAGLVTIEDLLEEIVGEIQDEYDTEEPMVVRISDDEARIDGRAAVDELSDLFGIELSLEDEAEYDTVGGLVFHRIGGVPTPGDRVDVSGLTITVETTDGRRVGRVLVVRNPTQEPGDQDR
jgi:putative hemolysin